MTKGKVHVPFSMSNYKTMYNNNLMLEKFMCMFTINPNTPKNQKIMHHCCQILCIPIYRKLRIVIYRLHQPDNIDQREGFML